MFVPHLQDAAAPAVTGQRGFFHRAAPATFSASERRYATSEARRLGLRALHLRAPTLTKNRGTGVEIRCAALVSRCPRRISRVRHRESLAQHFCRVAGLAKTLPVVRKRCLASRARRAAPVHGVPTFFALAEPKKTLPGDLCTRRGSLATCLGSRIGSRHASTHIKVSSLCINRACAACRINSS